MAKPAVKPATKKKAQEKKPEKNPVSRGIRGRPTEYKKEFNSLACVLCEETGANNEKLSEAFGVSLTTIKTWFREKKDFRAQVKAGREIFNREKIEARLIDRCIGYKYTETKVKTVELKGGKKQIVKEVTQKVLPPDVNAIMFYLRNRDPKRFNEKHRQQHNGELKIKVELVKTRAKPPVTRGN